MLLGGSRVEETNHCEKCGVEIDIWNTHCDDHQEWSQP